MTLLGFCLTAEFFVHNDCIKLWYKIVCNARIVLMKLGPANKWDLIEGARKSKHESFQTAPILMSLLREVRNLRPLNDTNKLIINKVVLSGPI